MEILFFFCRHPSSSEQLQGGRQLRCQRHCNFRLRRRVQTQPFSIWTLLRPYSSHFLWLRLVLWSLIAIIAILNNAIRS